jgi:chromosome segregation ATPase
MSEKNLAIRNKFLSKINNKMVDLNESLELLQKVDRKLIQQSGGSLKDLQVSVLQLAQKQNEVIKLSQTIVQLQQNMTLINERLAGLARSISQLNFNIPTIKMDDFKLDEISEIDFTRALDATKSSELPPSLDSVKGRLFPNEQQQQQQRLQNQPLVK